MKSRSPTELAIAGFVVAGCAAVAAAVAWAALSARTEAAPAGVTESQARSIALAWIGSRSNPMVRDGGPVVTGWSVTSDRYEPTGARVTDSSGKVVMTESGGFCIPVVMACGGAPVWEVELTAPPQGQWASYQAIVVLDASTGKVRSASAGAHN